ncbi:hypothetical protein TNCV_1797071 [Trichonephila clavipes]|nr:hypothetical protein TNCV_1797071 [Trichonephila clavipes]
MSNEVAINIILVEVAVHRSAMLFSNVVRALLEDTHIVRNARVQPTAPSIAIQAQVAPSLGALCLLEPYEDVWLNDIWDCCAHYVRCP